MAKEGNSKRFLWIWDGSKYVVQKEQLRKGIWLPRYPSGTGIIQLVPMVALYGRGRVVKECSRRGMSMGDWWRRGCVGCDDEGVWWRNSRVVMVKRSK
jgi:hypothetical protein